MNIIFPILFNVLAVIIFYVLDKRTAFGKIKNAYKQIIIGLVFGLVAISASELGLKISGATMNVRDSAPLSAGLIFGWPSGIIAGVIGGGYRALSVLWGGGTYTALACSVSAVIAGVLAALLRKFMFDNKKPTVAYAIGIAVVMEIFHMLMIFITNINDANTAFTFVRECTLPMATLNALTLSLSVLAVGIISKERPKSRSFIGKRKEKEKEQIAQTFQRWLVISILIAFISTSTFTFYIQTGMRETQIQETFKTVITDVIYDIRGKAETTIKTLAERVKTEYLKDTEAPLKDLAEKLEVREINVVSSDGIIINSTEESYFNFDMASSEQSSEFMKLVNSTEESFLVQEYGPIGADGVTMRKYGGVSLDNGGFLQIGYDDAQFHGLIDQYAIDFTKHRHVGAEGFIAVCDENLTLVTETKRNGAPLSIIGIEPNEEMLAKVHSSKIYRADVKNSDTDYSAEYLYVFTFVEGYCVIAAMPVAEAMLIRDASTYLSVFMQVLIFAALFVILYFLIKRLVIDNIHKINTTLSKISSGDLDETVDVRTNAEFAFLSDDINSTVDTLKRYIKEAAARIDRELEYAKQIQLSALPTGTLANKKVNVCAKMIAAKEVGGDFYDYYQVDEDNVVFMVADVSGKGIPAAMFMMTAKTTIKDLAERGLSASEILTQANEKLCENNDSGMFVTVWIGVLNTKTGKLTYANAGHNPPVLYKNGSFSYHRERSGFVLAGVEDIEYANGEMYLESGDRVFLYTDGVTEATNSEAVLYGEERLLEYLNGAKERGNGELLSGVKRNIDEFVGENEQFDDITMLLLEYKNDSDTKGE